MKHLHIDIETRSPIPIEFGPYRYAESAELLLFQYSVDGGPVHLVDVVNGEEIPGEVLAMLDDPKVIKHAYNANFERALLRATLGIKAEPEQWRCTMVFASERGFPGGLGAVCDRLGIERDKSKLASGAGLIRHFCVPRKNGGFAPPEGEKWQAFKEYALRDVEAEIAVGERLMKATGDLPDEEWRLWFLDQRINDRGMCIDVPFIKNAVALSEALRARYLQEAIELTGLVNPNSRGRLLDWLREESGEYLPDLTSKTVKSALAALPDGLARRVLMLRERLSKTSAKKYQTLLNATCSDGRLRGVLQFYGASRTGRWVGRIFQPQNLPRPPKYLESPQAIDEARRLVLAGDLDGLVGRYENPPEVLSALIRTAIVAPSGKQLAACDFSAIEARALAWQAKETWRLDVFSTHGKIYEASAAAMFGVPVERIAKGNPEYELRQKGKIAELALGYQGGANALVTMGALDMGLAEEELPRIVKLWRAANPRIVRFWYDLEAAAKKALREKRAVRLPSGVAFYVKAKALVMRLPSGRELYYPRAQEIDEQITYYGLGSQDKKWKRLDTYGGKLCENLIQGLCRDLLAYALFSAEKVGSVVLHVHDEIIVEAAESLPVEAFEDAMKRLPDWASGLPINASGFSSRYYRKDG